MVFASIYRTMTVNHDAPDRRRNRKAGLRQKKMDLQEGGGLQEFATGGDVSSEDMDIPKEEGK
jgi:hypothetical protein